MKMIFVIIKDKETEALTRALISKQYRVTGIASTGVCQSACTPHAVSSNTAAITTRRLRSDHSISRLIMVIPCQAGIAPNR